MSYSSFSTSVFGETKTSGIDCIPEQKTNIVNYCYKEYDTDTDDITAIYCIICYDEDE
ncbi:MAG TPA: hypothetical protein VFM28_11270 [Nitrososphaeraceae archaeon]|nr:hypothetical protein [Nitrososphaeraceae archaeon]